MPTIPSSTPRNTLFTHSSLLLLDGGLGTTLSQPPYNITFSSEATPLWSSHLLTSAAGRATLLQVQKSFARAGAQVVLTGTYQGSVEGFGRTRRVREGAVGGKVVGEEDIIGEAEARSMMRGAVSIARRALREEAREEGVVALSLGAYGATLVPSAEYSGEYGEGFGEEELAAWHRRRLEIFVDDEDKGCEGEKETVWRDVDVVAFETLPRVDEVRAVRRVMRGLERPFWVSCVFPGEKDGEERYRLPDGYGVAEVVEALMGGEEARPWGMGINCTKIWKVRELVGEFERALVEGNYGKTRLVLYPDGAGDLVYDTTSQEWVPMEGGKRSGKTWEAEMAEIVAEVMKRGAWEGVLVGGCCMTGPEQIKGLNERLR